jgi:hypothetical protein
MHRQFIGFLLLTLTLVGVGTPTAVKAHGGGVPMLTGVEAGGYRLYVWANPGNPRAGDTVHITVGVTVPGSSAALETPITDAAVTVRFVPQDNGAPLETNAVAGVSAGSLYYETDEVLPRGGNWQVTINVAGVQGSGAAEFTLPVGESKASGYLFIILGIVIVGLGIGLFVRQSRRATARPGQAPA